MNSVHFSSRTDEWSTPQAFFDELNQEFHFVGDVCASRRNAKCSLWLCKRDNSLAVDWNSWAPPGPLFMNPPYGRHIGLWVRKAALTARRGRTVVALLPSRTDTRWFQNDILDNHFEVRFVRGRLKFGGAKNSAPFPSAVVVFRMTQPLLTPEAIAE